MPRLVSLAAAATILVSALTQAAPLQAQPADITLDAAARADVIDGALRALNDAYVFPETAEKMAQAIRARQVVVDLSPWEGQTVRLRFAVADNLGPLRAGVDKIRFERLPQ